MKDKMGEMRKMQDVLISFIQEINPYDDFDENTDLIEEGLLDSLSIVGLIAEIEKNGKEIPLSAIKIDNFASVNAIMSLLKEIEKNSN